jgi:multidrug efflux pump subunit AcrA (membrane-fusion protein)
MSEPEKPHPQSQLFRQEALEHHARPQAKGSLLRIQPFWARVTFWLIAVLALTLGTGLALVEVNDYATGPVVMQVKGLEDVTITSPGRVSQVFVTKGQYVRVGQPLLELHSTLEEVESQRMRQEFRSQLAAGLLDPLNAGARQAISGLRTQMEMSEARLSERIIRATSDGLIHDVRAKPNQYLTAGQVVASILHDGAEVFALALVPGQYRPMVKPGQQIRVEISGFPYVYQYLEVTSVSDELVGPGEVRRILGPELGDAVQLQGPHVLVEGRLPSPTFQVDGHTYNYYTGMPGTAWVRIRARNGWLMLLPILEMFRKDHG